MEYLLLMLLVTPEILTDSNQKLFDLSKEIKATYLPISTHLFPVNKYSFSECIVFLRYCLVTLGFVLLGFFKDTALSKRQRLYFALTKNIYWKKMSESKIVLTGRYHGMCTAIITRTPFLVLNSNSHKVESLLEDIGLGNDRLICHEDLNNYNSLVFKQFSQKELTLIEEYCHTAEQEIDDMFDEIFTG